ncbi:MAG: tRNA (adenosine(37)-N6)-threonylcarbamoyltransferase complex transferase subunit TsaD [Rhabdochlamydiaceae bacterium]|nr:tRNA (adenosine(37)-N6)-threonylcarbamoyltransferase complex transferase subunit TsaD [Candidatus Amphrikana amoebophyrae]
MIVLGIETTCDETAASIVIDGKHILSNTICSQADYHSQFRGVFPEYASRNHVDLLLPTIEKSLTEANISSNDIDLIAVANRPGLMGPLLMGLNCAKALAFCWDIPFVCVNHLEAHLYAAMMEQKTISFPALGVVVSGGHTFMVEINSFRNYRLIGASIDDAIGEAFDKVAAMLNLPYPGGPEIEKLATTGDPKRYPFKAGLVKNNRFNFSFSGLKTQVLYAIKGANSNKHSPSIIHEEDKKDVAASFQQVALTDIVKKALSAAVVINATDIFVGGGVTNSSKLKEIFTILTPNNTKIHYPPKNLSIDNGAMIAGLGYHVGTSDLASMSFKENAVPSGAVLFD